MSERTLEQIEVAVAAAPDGAKAKDEEAAAGLIEKLWTEHPELAEEYGQALVEREVEAEFERLVAAGEEER